MQLLQASGVKRLDPPMAVGARGEGKPSKDAKNQGDEDSLHFKTPLSRGQALWLGEAENDLRLHECIAWRAADECASIKSYIFQNLSR